MNNTPYNTLPLKKILKMHLLVLVTPITNDDKASAMSHKSACNGSNSQLILKWSSYYIFCNNSQTKTKLSVNLVISDQEALIAYIKNGGKANANCYMNVGAGHWNKSQMILKWPK